MSLRYIGPPDLYYPTIPLTPTPGEVYDVDDPGDGRWVAADGKPVETGGDEKPAETGGDEKPAETGGEPPAETSLSVNVHPVEEV